MKRIRLNRYPDGKKKALTLSYDDGQIHDRRLVDIFNSYGMKGTFHLNSGSLDRQNILLRSEIADLFKGHEISAHSVNHPHLGELPNEELVFEITEDRRALELLAGYPVRGMSYPFGTYTEHVVNALPLLGIEYARTTASHCNFNIPENFLKWHPTCHHNNNLLEKSRDFKNIKSNSKMPLFYVWGHSYEFDKDDNWNLIEEFCKISSNDDEVWYATNIEIVIYINALKNLKFSVDKSMVYNNAAISVWISVDEEIVEIKPGQTNL